MTLDIGNDGRRTCGTRWMRDESTQIYIVAWRYTNICTSKTNLHSNANLTSTTRLHSEHHSGVNNQLRATAARHHRASGHNHDHKATDNDDSTVTTTYFSVIIIVAASGDEHLVPRYHTVLCATPNVELSILSYSGHVTQSALRTTTTNVQSLHPAAAWIDSPRDIITRVYHSHNINVGV